MKVGSTRARALMTVVVTVVAVTGLVVVALPAHAAPRAAVATDVKLKGGLNDPKDPNIAVLEFLPQTVKVATGTTVTWEIAGPEPHSVTFVPPGTASAERRQGPFTVHAHSGHRSVRRHHPGELRRPAPRGDLGGPEVLHVVRATPASTRTTACCTPTWWARCRSPSGTQDSQQKITKAGNAETKKYLAEGEAAKRKLLAAKPKQTKNSDGSTTYNVELGASTAHTDVLAFAPTPKNVKVGRPRHVREQLVGAAHRQLRRPARAHRADRRRTS